MPAPPVDGPGSSTDSNVGASAGTQTPIETGSPPAEQLAPPASPAPRRGGDELFVPDEAWDPVAAAARAMDTPSFSAAAPAPRPTYAGGAGIARPSRGRRWAIPVALVLVAALGGAGFFFRDQLLGLLPESAEEPPPVTAAVTSESTSPPTVVDAPPMDSDSLPATDAGGEPATATETAPPPPDATADLATPPGRDSGEIEAAAVPGPAAASGGPVTLVEEIRSWQRAGETVVTIQGNGELRASDYGELRLESPPRVVVKIFGIEEGYRPLTAVDSPELRQIRTALHPDSELHVVLDLSAADVEASVGVESGRLRIRLQR